jgi:hypothetical protein
MPEEGRGKEMERRVHENTANKKSPRGALFDVSVKTSHA